MTPYANNNDKDPEGSTRQGHQRHFVFEKRRMARAGAVPAPVAFLLLGCIAAVLPLISSPLLGTGMAAAACTVAIPILLQAGARPSMCHDAGRDVLCVRKGVSWKLLAGFRCTHLPTNVNGNQDRLVRHLHGIDPHVTFKVVVSRHEFPRESRSRSGSWFAPKGDDVAVLGAGESGHAWFLVLERPANLLLGVMHEVAVLARGAGCYPVDVPQHLPAPPVPRGDGGRAGARGGVVSAEASEVTLPLIHDTAASTLQVIEPDLQLPSESG
jgi:hypothetical protein